jgi:phage terminase large subunit-like protein
LGLAKEVIDWIEKECRIPEGRDVGKSVKLRSWQKKEIRKIYDNSHGTRQAILSFGRKNGKTALAAFLLLVHLCGPCHRKNSQLYSAAQSRDQAAILFGLAAKIVRMSETLSAYITVRESGKQLHCAELGTLYKALSAEASTAYGLSPVFIVHDELGQVKGPRSELYEALETATAAQEDPLSIVISTQAPTEADLLSVLIDDAISGSDKRVVVSLYSADTDIDAFSVKAIKQANPAYGDFQNAKEVKAMADAAKRMPAREAAYRNLVLNQRVNQVCPFVAQSVWKSCDKEAQEKAFQYGTVRAGLDLSARHDLTALILSAEYENEHHVRCEFFCPEEGIRERAAKDRVPYDLWHQQGFLTATPGASVDYEYVARRLVDICDQYIVSGIAFDRWRIDVLNAELAKAGHELPLMPFGQGFKDMSPALDILENELLNGRIRHGGNPVLTMCAANAVVDTDPAGNRKLNKSKSTGRIDGMVALAMAMGLQDSCVVEVSPWEDDQYRMKA